MGEVCSTDGTVIRWRQSGTGPALLVAHGGRPTPSEPWPPGRHLDDRLTIVVMGRRGYGFSDDSPAYSHHQEAEDIATVLDAIGGSRWLYGSSSGAICALAAAQLVDVEKLILFEPPLPVDRPMLGEFRIDVENALGRGDPEAGMVLCLRHGVRLDEQQIAARRASPGWADRVAFASAWCRDCLEIDRLPSDLERYRGIGADTLLIWATASHSWLRLPIEGLASVLPSTSVVPIPGHGHDAAETAPAEVAHAVGTFLLGVP